MTDDPFYKPGLVIPLRQPQPGKHQWTVTKGPRRLDCEIRSRMPRWRREESRGVSVRVTQTHTITGLLETRGDS
jgi:hypothetical protein